MTDSLEIVNNPEKMDIYARLAQDAGISVEEARNMSFIDLYKLVSQNHKPYQPDPIEYERVRQNQLLAMHYERGMFR